MHAHAQHALPYCDTAATFFFNLELVPFPDPPSLTLIMSLLQYFETAHQLPDPKGPLSSSISSSAIALPNQEVLEAATAKKSRSVVLTKSK